MRKSIKAGGIGSRFCEAHVFGELARQANSFAGQWGAGGSDRGVVGRFGGRAWPGASARSAGQTRDQTGRSPAEQRRDRRMGPVCAMGARGLGQRRAIVVAMEWTDFDADNQATLALSLITRHGRATPLLF